MERYFWVKFYPAAEWQIVKFWDKNGIPHFKALDWGLPHEVEKFDNKTYEIGPEIQSPVRLR